MIKLTIYGRLRKFIGQSSFEIKANSAKEAFSFLVNNFKGVREHMKDQEYCVMAGDLRLTEELIDMQTKSDIKIVPVVHGEILPFVFGAGALFASSAITAGTFLGSTLLVNALTAVGTSLIIDGVTQMITPQASMTSAASNMDITDPAALAANYSFTGLTNVSRAGVPINLVFGEILVGSITISNGVDTVQVEGP